jgi:uncharacterized protein YdeI (YjbR/CyaY-like superfamily)
MRKRLTRRCASAGSTGRSHDATTTAIASASRSAGQAALGPPGTSSTSPALPPDLAQALAANPAAATTFDQLDAANRYAIVYRINTVKRPATRDRKLAEYVGMLVRGESIHPRKRRKDRQ